MYICYYYRKYEKYTLLQQDGNENNFQHVLLFMTINCLRRLKLLTLKTPRALLGCATINTWANFKTKLLYFSCKLRTTSL